MTRTLPPVDLDQSLSAANLPRHRVIVAVDIEQSTSRPDRVKAELRRTLYELFLSDYNASLPSAGRAGHQLRIRIVMHAGEVHYDSNGCFGEALDIAFRLLDAPGVKKTLRATAAPLTLVISEDIYRTIVRHGYDGIDPHAFRPLIRVHLAGHRYRGWIHTPSKATQLRVTEIASYKQTA